MDTTPEERRKAAIAEGSKALLTGRAVIWVHGIPYADPSDEEEPAEHEARPALSDRRRTTERGEDDA